jgi:hypothetical protein
MSEEQEKNLTRDFNALSDRTNTICRFFLSGNCKNKNCKFSHSISTNIELTPKQIIISNIEIAINRGRLGDIFEKMLLNEDDAYNKYYFEIHMKFRGYAVMKLKKQSVVKTFIDGFQLRDLNIGDIKLNYGYIPFFLHFFIMGFAWNTFQGAKDSEEDGYINECFEEFVVQLQKRYNDDEYDDIIKEACQFVDPETNENMIMIASHYLCDRVVSHIKDTFKNIKRREFTKDQLSTMRSEMGEENFNRFICNNFTDFINDETNNLDENAFDLFNKRKLDSESAYQKYNEKYQKSIARARGNQKLIDDATKKYDWNMKQYLCKVTIFYNSIFNENIQRKKLIMSNINYDNIFLSRFENFVGAANKFGTRCNPDVLTELIHILNNELIKKKDMYMKMIIEKIPSNLMNPDHIIKVFKEKKVIDYLWNYILNTITIENPGTFCIELLNAFFKEPSGLQEAYVSVYLEKITELGSNMSSSEKEQFIENIMKSMISKNIKDMIIL